MRVSGYAGPIMQQVSLMQKEMEEGPWGCPFEIVEIHDEKKPSKNVEADAVLLDCKAGGSERPLDEPLPDGRLVIDVQGGAGYLRSAIKAREAYINPSSRLVSGPVLVQPGKIKIDYDLYSDDEECENHYLKIIDEQNALTFGRTLLELALGNFARDDMGNIYFKGKPVPHGLQIENWNENRPIYQRKTDKLLYPASVAVIGASLKQGMGRSIVENILKDGFTGDVYAINVRGEDVLSAKGYRSVLDIEGPLDLAVIAVPSAIVPEVLESCGKKGVYGIVCISAGFKEIGGEGIAAQEKLSEIVSRYNMRLIGPNCMGLMSVKVNLNATILKGHIAKGNVALVTQSGAIGAQMLDHAGELGIGFSAIVSLGNQADITACDLLPFFEQDENTRVIVLYLESILEPVRFWRLASRVNKPILLIKAGSTSVGMAAASSHTGSLAGNDKIADALIRKAGIIRVDTIEELFLCTAALANQPQLKGERIGHMTNGGGPGILVSDALSNSDFSLPVASDELRTNLRQHLMREASVQNPIDIVAPAPIEHYVFTLNAMLESGEFDALPISCIPPATLDTALVAEAMLPLLKKADIPVMTCFMGPVVGKNARDIMVRNNIPSVVYPEQLVTMLKGLRKRQKFTLDTGRGIPGIVLKQGRELLASVRPGEYMPVSDAHKLLRLFGIPTPLNALLKTAEDAASAGLSFPVVAKIEHPEIIHKSDAGGVRMNIASEEELAGVTADFLKRFPGARGVYVQEQVPDGLELIAGGISDPMLGSAVMVGLGGIWVEVMKDVVFGYPPIGRDEALAMIKKLRCEPLLAGFRGKAGVNIEALALLLEKISALLLALPEIGELDLNPVIYSPGRDLFIPADLRVRKAQ